MRIVYRPTIKAYARIYLSSERYHYKKFPCDNVLLKYSQADKLCEIELLSVPDFKPEALIVQHYFEEQPTNTQLALKPMPPLELVTILINKDILQSLRLLSKQMQTSVNAVIISLIVDHFAALGTVFPNEFTTKPEFEVQNDIGENMAIRYYPKLNRVLLKLNNRKAMYIHKASGEVDVYYDSVGLVTGFEIRELHAQPEQPFELTLDYQPKRGKPIYVPEHQIAAPRPLYLKLPVSAEQYRHLREYSSDNIPALIETIINNHQNAG